MSVFHWSPTILYAILAVVVSLHHGRNMAPVIDVIGRAETQFRVTHEGLKQGERLSQEAQIEMARLGSVHTHNAGDYVGWTQGVVWWLTLPGIVAAALQGVVSSRLASRRKAQ